MAFWLTCHWAHPNPDDLPWFLYRKELTKRDDLVAQGDGILFFQGNRPEDRDGGRKDFADRVQRGKRQRVPLVKNSPGIVCAGRISGPRRKIGPEDVVYDYGNVDAWTYLTPCAIDVRRGPIGLREIQRALHSLRPPPPFGLLPLTHEQHAKLLGLLTGLPA